MAYQQPAQFTGTTRSYMSQRLQDDCCGCPPPCCPPPPCCCPPPCCPPPPCCCDYSQEAPQKHEEEKIESQRVPRILFDNHPIREASPQRISNKKRPLDDDCCGCPPPCCPPPPCCCPPPCCPKPCCDDVSLEAKASPDVMDMFDERAKEFSSTFARPEERVAERFQGKSNTTSKQAQQDLVVYVHGTPKKMRLMDYHSSGSAHAGSHHHTPKNQHNHAGKHQSRQHARQQPRHHSGHRYAPY